MPDHRTPKICLFSWLPQLRPQGGPRLRWKDVIRKDLRATKVSEEKWYDEASISRLRWQNTYKEGLKSLTANDEAEAQEYAVNQIKCDECNRTFRRESDRKHHKCISERQKPVSEQRGAVQCTTCTQWFRSCRGLSVHRCRPDQASKTFALPPIVG